MIGTLAELSDGLPEAGFGWSGAKAFKLLAPGHAPSRYVTLAILLSVGSGLLIGFILSFFGLGIAFLSTLAILTIGTVCAFLLYLPKMELQRKIADIEAAMPFFLRSMGMLIEMGLPFQKAIERSCDGEGALHMEMRHVLREIESGIGLQRALVSFAIAYPSPAIKRTVSQMLSAYETGSRGEELMKMGDELLALEQHNLKEYSSRSSVFGLLFIMTSALAPTFFLVYAIAGRFALMQRIEQGQMTIVLLIVFPCASILLLMLSKATMPPSAFDDKKGFDPLMMVPGIALVLGYVFFPGFELETMVLAIGAAIYLVAKAYGKESRAEELERSLPDALFSVSGMPRSTRVERIFSMIEDNGYGALSIEAGKSRMQLEMNVRLKEVLDDLWSRNRSLMLKRACIMLRQMIETNSLHRLNLLAQDMSKAFQTMRERSQMFGMQKYTLLFGAILIPLIMKMTISLLGSIGTMLGGGGMGNLMMGVGGGGDVISGSDTGFGNAGGLGADVGGGPGFGNAGGLGTGAAGSGSGGSGGGGAIAAMVAYSLSIVPPYLVIYAMIVALAIADAEGKRSSAAMYFIGMCAASLLIFHFINL